ncbi:hypothetical protein BGZ61DRAFT_455153 [Ilyonectria robusta]|uniref:uncharacterized protein n=1 Tax=Ilyonectria robusta TaxID=1079257 RepID=UPI001E8D67EA|nr:uncharacterized protein BGZ61DRAFT_455153 [Ilyonectria robusta]KAH8685241.1 hypothetical protein BGZ61DRAFT_455153 [Ilyonectria robusta]
MTKATGLSDSIWAKGRPHVPRPWPASSSSVSLPSIASAPTPSSASASASVTNNSRPPVSASASAPAPSGHRLTPSQAFHRFEQACQRLRWKFLDLQTSYQRATSPEEHGFTKVDAERNFKVDFHEFYVWIEQAIVLLLLIFGVSISRNAYGGPSLATNFGHAYHHNVLKALEEEGCPVHGALGHGEVNQALWKAKELRNRWKDAAEGRETPPLKMYDLTWIVTMVLCGLEEAYAVAARHVALELQMETEQTQAQGASSNGNVGNDTASGGEMDDEWEWMVEPMDWEAA